MGTIKDIYDVVKDLRTLAKEANNQPMIELAVDIQDKLFDMREIMQDLKETNKDLVEKLKIANETIEKLKDKYSDYDKLKQIVDDLNNNLFEFPDDDIVLNFTEETFVYSPGYELKKQQIKTNLKTIFHNISLNMTTAIENHEFQRAFSNMCHGYYVKEKQALEIKAKLLAFGLIEVNLNKKDVEIIKLSHLGLETMKSLNIKKQGENK